MSQCAHEMRPKLDELEYSIQRNEYIKSDEIFIALDINELRELNSVISEYFMFEETYIEW